MFIRKKKNPSGVVSVQVIDKSRGVYKVIKTIGSSSDETRIDELWHQGRDWITVRLGQRDMFAECNCKQMEKQLVDSFLSNVENVLINGVQLILEQVFAKVGFDAIEDEIFRHLVVARLCMPTSKSATVDYLKSYFDQDINLNKTYRYLDKLYNTQRDKIQQISVAHTMKILGGTIGLVFYDVTTLYFETDFSDELRERGFSKDGKHSQPQVVLGLLVSRDGYPLSYSLFNGSQYEGRTMLPIVEDFVSRFRLNDFVVVADSGLMNKTNIALLESVGYKYIIGARIKNETEEVKSWILSLEKNDGQFYELGKLPRKRLIISYSGSRAKKDADNRDKGVKRLTKAYKSGIITKENINKRGYNKFLNIAGDVTVAINKAEISKDAQWDGLKGYLTNTNLSPEEVYAQYHGLWVIERAYRVTKGTLEMRPIFHFTPRRIEAHVCICFVAYKVYKELERILKVSGIPLSVDKVISIAKTITTLRIRLPYSNETADKTMIFTKNQQLIKQLFEPHFWNSL